MTEANSWAAALDEAKGRDLRAVVAALRDAIQFRPLPHQEPPPDDRGWFLWMMLGGRMSGKTQAASGDFDAHMMGPPCDPRVPGGHRALIVAPTIGDGHASCIDGPSGIRALNPKVTVHSPSSGTYVRWPNGAVADLRGAYTAENVERLRASGNRCRVWAEEFATWVHLQAAFDHLLLGTRLGPTPRIVASTTPKPRAVIKNLVAAARAWETAGAVPPLLQDRVVVTRATSMQNPFIGHDVRAGLMARYEGTRLGRQELYGELVDDYEGALWNREDLDRDRILPTELPELWRKSIGIDPSTWGPEMGQAHESVGQGIETGVVACGVNDVGQVRHVYVLADESGRKSPTEWARLACGLYHRLGAAALVPEKNNAGWVGSILRGVDESVFIDGVTAKQGKRIRAEPVAALSEQRRFHMVGTFPELEDQLCGWDPTESWSPDRLDAMVHAATWLKPWGSRGGLVVSAADRTL